MEAHYKAVLLLLMMMFIGSMLPGGVQPPTAITQPFPTIPPIRCRPLKSSQGISGNAVSPPTVGTGAETQPKSNLVHFSVKIRHLVATVLTIFLRIN